MADTLYVNKPGSSIVHLKDGTSAHLKYGDKVPDNVADYVDVTTFADDQPRRVELDASALQEQEANLRAALTENGQPNSSSSPVPGNYSELDEDGAATFIAQLSDRPQDQAAVLMHEIVRLGGRRKVVDAATDQARSIASTLLDGPSEEAPAETPTETPAPQTPATPSRGRGSTPAPSGSGDGDGDGASGDTPPAK